MLEMKIKKDFPQLKLDVELSLPTQGITAIFGLSGSGKTTLVNTISGLLAPDQGYIVLNQRCLFNTQKKINIPPHQRHIGYVFQEDRLFPHYTVKGNLCYGQPKKDPHKLNNILELLGIEHLMHRYPNTLSGGERQRVAIGRALLSEPELLIMDEPLSALDLPRRQEILHYLDHLAKHTTIPIFYVTHSTEELARLAEQVVLMDKGKVLAYEALEQIWQSPLFKPWQSQQHTNLFTLPVIPNLSSTHTTALAIGSQTLWVNTNSLFAHSTLRIGIASQDIFLSLVKPQHISLQNVLQGKIEKMELQTDQAEILIDIQGIKLCSTISLWAYHKLALLKNESVYALIKAISIIK